MVTALQIGSTLAGYRIERVIGTGHTGTVYLAQSPDLPRHEALKVADPDLMDDAELRERFVREAEVGARFTHPNIVGIYRRGEDDGLLWIAMQHIEGIDASAALKNGRIAPARAVHIITEIARAIDHAHSLNVVHRDIKPANFLLSKDGPVLLGDFGTAHILGQDEPATSGAVLATLPYAAPEVLTGKPVGERADIYSLGCSLFRLLAGHTPFSTEGDTPAVIARQLRDPAPRVSDSVPQLPPAMDAVIARALAKDPQKRFHNAQALAAAAAAALKRPTTTPPSAKSQPPPSRTRPKPAAPAPQQQRPATPASAGPPAPAPAPKASPTPAAAAATTGFPGDVLPAAPPSPWKRPDRDRMIRLAGAAAAAAAILITSIVWLTSSSNDDSAGGPPPPDAASHTEPTQAPSSPSTPLRDRTAEAKLLQALPPGYPPNSCKPVTPSGAAQAALRCTITVAPSETPISVTHQLMPTLGALNTTFTSILDDTKVLICPGRIQSPGPWRRSGTTQLISGTVACGLQQGRPFLTWTTTDTALLVSTVQSNTGEATLDELYTWWSRHS